MGKQVLGIFQSHDVADSVKDAFVKEGYDASNLIVMVNRESAEPPEDARLEVGTDMPGLASIRNKLTKTIREVLHPEAIIEGDGSEGEGKGGALLAIRLEDDLDEARVRAILERHHASDIEVAEAD